MKHTYRPSTKEPRERTYIVMNNALASRIARPAGGGMMGYVQSLLLVATSTLIGLAMAPKWGNAAVDLVYLPGVLAVAILAGLGPALMAAIASALSYNYFFTAPYHSLQIHSPADIVTVVMLFLVALVTSHLASSVRMQAQIAEAHAARNATIAGLARKLLTCTREQEITDAVLKELTSLFRCNAVMIADAGAAMPEGAIPPSLQLTPSDLAAAATVFTTGKATGRGIGRVSTVEWQLHPVCSGPHVLRVVGLARDDGIPAVDAAQMELLNNLLDQVALAIERARLETGAREFSTLRERDRVRSALVASLDQDLGPSLTAIDQSIAGLKRAGTDDKDNLSMLGREALKVRRYLENLNELGPESDQQPVDIGGVSIDVFRRVVTRDGITVRLTPKEYAILAELAKHPGRVLSHAHLLKVAWGPAQQGHTEYLRVAVRALRQKLERDPARPAIIINEPAVGYRLAG